MSHQKREADEVRADLRRPTRMRRSNFPRSRSRIVVVALERWFAPPSGIGRRAGKIPGIEMNDLRDILDEAANDEQVAMSETQERSRVNVFLLIHFEISALARARIRTN